MKTDLEIELDAIVVGRRGFSTFQEIRKATRISYDSIRMIVREMYPTLYVERHGRYGFCIFRKHSGE